MSPIVTILAWLFGGLFLGVLAVWLWRQRRERPVHVDKLWRFPAIMTAIILPLAYLQPHRPFHWREYGIFAFMVALGVATGAIRAKAARLRMDHPTQQLMAGLSAWVLVMLIPVGAARQFAREHLGMGIAALQRGDVTALIGSLLFALAMIVAYRLTLYWRARRFIDRHAASAQGGAMVDLPASPPQ